MLDILKNDFRRTFQNKQYVIIATILTMVSIIMAVFITNNVQMKMKVGLIDKNSLVSIPENKYLDVVNLDGEPKKSDVVMGRYDAIVEVNDDMGITVTSRSNDIKEKLESFFDGSSSEVSEDDTERKVGSNIIGYMMMFLLMQGVIYGKVFSEDKEKHVAERITVSPIAFRNYILGHISFIVLMIFVPSYVMILITKLVGVNIGFSLLQYAAIILFLGFLAASFAIFLGSLFKVSDTANMVGNSTLILTSLLSGSFYSFTKNSDILDKVIRALPQKDFMSFIESLEKGTITNTSLMYLTYVTAFMVIVFLIAVVKTKKDYVYKR